MATYFLIFIAGFVLAAIIGIIWHKYIMASYTAYGICIRGNDGEVYLKLSELGQRELANPSTNLLVLRVMDAPTRNKQAL